MMSPDFIDNYKERLVGSLASIPVDSLQRLAGSTLRVWRAGGQLFLCGNGGSAGNANHVANDFVYGVAKVSGRGIRAVSLAANQSVMTCLANDIGYDNMYSEQLKVQGRSGDCLIILSGSGNSQNVLNCATVAREIGIESHAILGFDGGKCMGLVDNAIHVPVDDMQVSEDLQLVLLHMVMQYLYAEFKERGDV